MIDKAAEAASDSGLGCSLAFRIQSHFHIMEHRNQ